MRKNKSRKNKLLALLLSTFMVTSFAGTMVACTDGDDSSSSSSSSSTEATVYDDALLKNASFETFNTKNGTELIGTSASKWTRNVNSASSGSALSSKTASGIVNTTTWDYLTGQDWADAIADVTQLTEKQAKAKWNKMSAKDKLLYLEHWEKQNKNDKDKDVEDLEFYQNFNIDSEDIPTCENPLTHDTSNTENKNVLMLHNSYSNASYETFGTAQFYRADTTIKIAVGQSAMFSVWVKTADLKCTNSYGESQEAVDKGAYIKVEHTLGATTPEPLMVENINTQGVTENNGWVQYEFYLQGSTVAESTFNIVLGLGQDGGTKRAGYVEGYAFFDDIECKIITGEDYTAGLQGKQVKTVYLGTEDSERTVDATADYDAYAIDFSGIATQSAWNTLDHPDWKIDPTTQDGFTAATKTGFTTYQGLGINTDDDIPRIYEGVNEMSASTDNYVKAVYNNNVKDNNLFTNGYANSASKILTIISVRGAAYTASLDEYITLAPNTYKGYSVWVKTSDMSNYTGANISLYAKDSATSPVENGEIFNINTATLDPVTIGEKDDVYGGWQQCFFFVSNETNTNQEFRFTYGFGPTTVKDKAKTDFYSGFALFTGFKEYSFVDKKSFECAASGTYAKIVSLETKVETAEGDGGFDTAVDREYQSIKDGFALTQNYKGVDSNSAYVKASNTSLEVNANVNAGLLNKKYEYVLDENDMPTNQKNDKYTQLLAKLGGAGATWNSVFGKETTQPLVIYNDVDQTKSYGYIGQSTMIAENGYATVSARVKVSGNAKAFIYLVDMDDDTHESNLSIGTNRIYWYDSKGNICIQDPTDKSTFKPLLHVAFKLQKNGLYKVNPNWAGASAVDKDAYYANLLAYGTPDTDGNLLVAEGGVSYNYTTNWLNDGNDGIAYYGYNAQTKTAYADSKKTVKVTDLSTVANLPARYEAVSADNNQMRIEIGNTNGKWAKVNFYIQNGDTAKNYRLEVWCGDRDGGNLAKANSFVAFDAWNPTQADSTSFNNLLTNRKDEIDDKNSLGNYFESVFSFYDTAKFLRYDATADKNKGESNYDDYLSSAYEENVAYLNYANTTTQEYEVYANYTVSDTAVEVDKVEDEDTSDDTATDTETPETETNVFLLVTSIVTAVLLLFAVVSLILRKYVIKRRKIK